MSDIDVRVKLCKSEDEYWDFYDEIAELINSDEAINKVFAGREDRLYSSSMLSLICDKDKPIGFACLVKENYDPNFLFLDMGIIEEYREKHIASSMLKALSKINKKFIIIDTSKRNTLANNSLKNNAAFIYEKGDRNIYLLQKNKKKEFFNNGYYELLKEHYDLQGDRISIITELCKEDKKGKVKTKTYKENR